MAKFVPHDKAFSYSQLLNKTNNCLLVATIILPIVSLLLKDTILFNLVNLTNIIAMVAFALLTYLLSYYLLPLSESIRRADYYSNTFGIPAIDDPSDGYYTNDEIDQGFYKMAVNLFENIFFSYNVSKEMLKKSTLKTAVLMIPLIIFAYIGFGNNNYAQSFLQLFLSIIIFGETIKLFLYFNNVKHMLDEVKNLFEVKNFKRNIGSYSPRVIRLHTDYETNISWGGLLLDSNIFNRLNPTLTQKWARLKTKYKISNFHKLKKSKQK